LLRCMSRDLAHGGRLRRCSKARPLFEALRPLRTHRLIILFVAPNRLSIRLLLAACRVKAVMCERHLPYRSAQVFDQHASAKI